MSYLGKYAGLFFGNYFGLAAAAPVVEIVSGQAAPAPGGGGLSGWGRHERGRGVFYPDNDRFIDRLIRDAVREVIEGPKVKRPERPVFRRERPVFRHTTPVNEAALRILGGSPLFRGLEAAPEVLQAVEAETARYDAPILMNFLGVTPFDNQDEDEALALLLCLS